MDNTALQESFATFTSKVSDEDMIKHIEDAEQIMGRSAALLLAKAGLDGSTKEPFKLLDNACGWGTIGANLQGAVDKSVLEKSHILCADFSAASVDVVKQRAKDKGWLNTETMVIDAQDSKLPGSSFTHITISHGMHVIPDPDAVLRDTLRILQPAGVFACSTMHRDNLAWGPDILSALKTLPFETALPDPVPMTANGRPEWADPKGVEEQLRKFGFENIRTETIEHTQHIVSAESFVGIFSMMLDVVVNTYWTKEQKAAHYGTFHQDVVRHLKEKHDGKGWDLNWTMILATCKSPS